MNYLAQASLSIVVRMPSDGAPDTGVFLMWSSACLISPACAKHRRIRSFSACIPPCASTKRSFHVPRQKRLSVIARARVCACANVCAYQKHEELRTSTKRGFKKREMISSKQPLVMELFTGMMPPSDLSTSIFQKSFFH